MKLQIIVTPAGLKLWTYDVYFGRLRAFAKSKLDVETALRRGFYMRRLFNFGERRKETA